MKKKRGWQNIPRKYYSPKCTMQLLAENISRILQAFHTSTYFSKRRTPFHLILLFFGGVTFFNTSKVLFSW